MTRNSGLRVGALLVVGLVVGAITGAAPAGAAPPVGNYAVYTVAGANPSWTGTIAVPGAATFPTATFATDSNTPTVPSGASAFLNPSTPFGAVFGSSQNLPYLSLRTSAGNTTSTTTITFASPTPAAGWGFALGDIDADRVTITASGPGGAVAAAGLGWQSAFNSCAASPVPSGCTGGPPYTDAPTWDPSTSTLTGNVADTSGASGWFTPTVPLTSLTLVFTPQSGLPIYQLWIAANTASISGTVTGPTGTPVDGGTVSLLTPDEEPVVDSAGASVEVTTGADGTFAIPGVVVGEYVVVVEPPAGSGLEPTAVTVDTSAGDVSGLTIALTATPPAPTPTPSAETGLTAPGELPATGAPTTSRPLALFGALLLLTGAGALLVAGRRARSRGLLRVYRVS